jgi:hypothetical protein
MAAHVNRKNAMRTLEVLDLMRVLSRCLRPPREHDNNVIRCPALNIRELKSW